MSVTRRWDRLQIEVVDPQLGAFLEVTREHTLHRAERVDADMAAGKPSGPLAGVSAVSIPRGFNSVGLPIRLQLMGPLFGETLLLQVARLYEREMAWYTRRPNAARQA